MQFLTYTETRRRLREVLDAAEAGMPTGIERHGSRVALVERDRPPRALGRLVAVGQARGGGRSRWVVGLLAGHADCR